MKFISTPIVIILVTLLGWGKTGTAVPVLRGTKTTDGPQWRKQNLDLYLDDELVSIKGVTWNGPESDVMSFMGLWRHSMEFYMDRVRELGINAIRVPFSSEAIFKNRDSMPFQGYVQNDIECHNKTVIEILDLFFVKTLRKNMLVVLNLNRLHKDYISEKWWDSEYTIQMFFETWEVMLDRYHTYTNLFALDIYEEPHDAAANQGWNQLCVDFITKTETKYPNNTWFYFVQGLEWGNSFSNLTQFPFPQKIIYTPHVFDKDFYVLNPKKSALGNLYGEWDTDFGFMIAQNKTVILTKAQSESNIWMNFLANYAMEKNLRNIFLWNLNNDPTFGILYDDWQTFDPNKMNILNSIQPNSSQFFFQNYKIKNL
jgi:endoglucanase